VLFESNVPAHNALLPSRSVMAGFVPASHIPSPVVPWMAGTLALRPRVARIGVPATMVERADYAKGNREFDCSPLAPTATSGVLANAERRTPLKIRRFEWELSNHPNVIAGSMRAIQLDHQDKPGDDEEGGRAARFSKNNYALFGRRGAGGYKKWNPSLLRAAIGK
jgi:hypothetical protein